MGSCPGRNLRNGITLAAAAARDSGIMRQPVGEFSEEELDSLTMVTWCSAPVLSGSGSRPRGSQ